MLWQRMRLHKRIRKKHSLKKECFLQFLKLQVKYREKLILTIYLSPSLSPLKERVATRKILIIINLSPDHSPRQERGN
jgi:hypothetical protein